LAASTASGVSPNHFSASIARTSFRELRPLLAKDAPVVQRLVRSRKVAHLTHWLFLPHSGQKALRWIDFVASAREEE
jgi:hypothetical protein